VRGQLAPGMRPQNPGVRMFGSGLRRPAPSRKMTEHLRAETHFVADSYGLRVRVIGRSSESVNIAATVVVTAASTVQRALGACAP